MDQYGTTDPTAAMAGMMGAFGIVWLLVAVFFIFLWFKIFSKAGFSGWLSLLLLVPIANLVLIIWFAFADWPALKKA
jgi:hypothetical protein